ncbi:MAG: hypothetical protein MUP69_05095 [Candidatus Atribacteria bacterium]|nr:hypothetical protein [Candidatus Atribacteria bacterium]
MPPRLNHVPLSDEKEVDSHRRAVFLLKRNGHTSESSTVQRYEGTLKNFKGTYWIGRNIVDLNLQY